ncbi:MAG: beta-lactamase family protein, partial [Candidatus Hydrogenedentes bacterium]|nr:beta-lactamase family protein [Candidatus Hydrogenedentota bacterium]
MHALSQRVSLVALSGLVILSQYGSAQAPPVTDPNAAPSTSSKDFPAEPAELDAFLTPLLTRQLEELHIPGISFVLVKNGRILFMKGYGYADRDRKLPVDPERTVFRVASVSKVVTATAAMQLVERGMLRVDDPVNAQLKAFQIKETFRPPITLGNLLTHTAGFDESAIGRRARSAADLEPLGAYLAHSIPPQVFPAGTVLNYSNHGMALAGYLVEEASGVPFEKYMDENVFKPLGMTRSSFALPEALAQDLALGYEYDDGVYTPRHYEYIKTIPSSMLVTTASDMARFM